MTANACQWCGYRMTSYAEGCDTCGACIDGGNPCACMTPDGLGAFDDYATWSGIADLVRMASWTAAFRDDDPVHAADRLRTLGRMLDYAAGEVRGLELCNRQAREVKR